jgi:uncharacterized integral membrane protein (TIGR00697 family)
LFFASLQPNRNIFTLNDINSLIDYLSQHPEQLWLGMVCIDLGFTLLMFRLFGKLGLYSVIVFDYVLCNIQGPKLTEVFGYETSLGMILYAGIYFATDLLSEKYGKREANRAVWMGFAASMIMVLVMSISILFQPSDRAFAQDAHGAIKLLFLYTPRFVFGSILAYLVSQKLDVFTFHYIKKKTKGKHLWLRNNLSTITSQAVDTVLYAVIVWWGTVSLSEAFALAAVKYVFKVVIALVDTPFIYWARSWNVEARDWSEIEPAEDAS